MLPRFLSVLMIAVFSVHSFAESIEVRASLQISAEHDELDLEQIESEGWTIKQDDDGETSYLFEATIDKSKLPLNKEVGPAFLKISKSGLVRVGMSIGDADAGSEAQLQLPSANGKFLKTPPLIMKVSGGEYASGAWSLNGTVEITVK